MTLPFPKTLTIKGRTYKVPSHGALQRMIYNDRAKCPDGCITELDGGCTHGFANWLSYLGIL